MTIFSTWAGWRGRVHVPSGAQQPTMRQVLSALDAGEPVLWIPAGSTDAGQARQRQSQRALYFAAVVIVLISGCAWLAATHPAARPVGGLLAALPPPRLEQSAATIRPPIEQSVLEPARSEPEALILVTEHVIEVEAGQRARLSAHVANDGKMPPETIALVKGLPHDVRLSDGIMIEPGLWMLRPDLLASVELDAARSASGRHELTLELRTSEGTVVSTGRTVVAVAAVGHDQDQPASTARGVVEPVVPDVGSARQAATRRTRAAPVAQERGAVAATKRKVKVAKPAQRTAPRLQSQITVLAAKPAVPQPAQPPRLVWPGDDPRSASYLPGPPVFLGGFVPGAEAKPPATGGNAGWRKRMSRR